MKNVILWLGLCYGLGQTFANERDIPHVVVDRQGNVMNYAALYRTTDGQVVIRYFFHPSINRLTVEDLQGHSYALNTLIRDQLREGLLRWADAAGNRFRVEEVFSVDQANLVIYGDSTHSQLGLMAAGIPRGLSVSPDLPREPRAGTIYFFGRAMQTFLYAFQNTDGSYSQRFRRSTGININDVSDYLQIVILWCLFHESGHVLGLGHTDTVTPPREEYSIRPIVEHLPSPILPGVQMMISNDLDYLEGRYQELGGPVHISEIIASSQERWVMQYLWNRRHQTLDCQPMPSSSAMMLNVSDHDACLTALPGPILPSIWWLLVN